ncbi:uncharacterized protein, partial [Miscanthus floridulus]|uniref:uncharacterized protein n=1 Tax=Miscanthus floridulus TaxID=154761 RepID=UPI003458DA13
TYRIDRQKQKKVTDFVTLHYDYINQWENFHDNLYKNDQPHMNANFRAYLAWYRRATRTKLKVQWTQADYADIESSDDEYTSYDLATRAGTQVEAAPILDRVGNTLKQSVLDIEHFSITGVHDRTMTQNFLTRLAHRLSRAAARCGCGTSVAMDVHAPPTGLSDTSVCLGTSSHGGTASRGQSSSRATMDTFQGLRDEDEDEDENEGGYEELGPSQLLNAPSTQPTQPDGTRRRHPPDPYTPGTWALGHKGKGKTRRQRGLVVDFLTFTDELIDRKNLAFSVDFSNRLFSLT